MICEITVRDPDITPVEWPKVDYLKKGPIKFGPGLTFLYGPNGSGKSTLTLALFHAEQSSNQVLTFDSLRSLTNRKAKDWDFLGGLEVKHDGEPVTYFDADQRVGLVGGMAGFDSDFMLEGITNIFNAKASAGQAHIARLNRVLGSKPASLVDKVKSREPSKAERAAREFLKANTTPGDKLWEQHRPTIILDEPERSLSLPLRRDLWHLIARGSLNNQVIVATHDPLVLWFPPVLATFIETKGGYLKECRDVLTEMQSFETFGEETEPAKGEPTKSPRKKEKEAKK